MSDKLLEIVLKFLPFIIPVLKSLTQKKKLYELNILFIDDEHEDLAIIKTLRDNKEF